MTIYLKTSEGLDLETPGCFHRYPGETDVIQHRVKLTDDTSILCKPYPLPHAMREELRNEVDSMLEMVVRP